MSPDPPGRSRADGWYGPPTGDPLAARLFPPLPGKVLWGLDRMQRIMAAVGSPQRDYPALVVGGTNGKGSVAHVWARILQASGCRVGLYTSPHLVHFRERIQVDGEPLSGTFLEEVADQLRSPIVKRQPSFFEATTALALTAFARAEVDVAVLEVGLGGRLDAVNIVDPILTAVTNIGLEHQDMLGDSHAAIALEKAGIFRPGVPAFTSATHPEALRVLGEEAASLGLLLARVGPAPGRSTLSGLHPGTDLRLKTRSWGDLELHTPLLGAHQRTNVSLAVRALEALPPRLIPSRRAVVEGVASARVPGRLQLVEEGPHRLVLDVAHNLEGVASLVEALRELAPPRPRVAVVGILADKPVDAMLRALASGVDHLILTVPPTAPPDRRWDPVAVAAAMSEVGAAGSCEGEPELERAMERARALVAGGGTIVVTGSFYTVGGVLRLLD
ncbi:MAG: bifunctional folylpolyglutamate synthase/dihydrofolate synthase [Gemmatimonadales bacterium]|nr:MAG: bifunctional folylpolyglutamate synthase/dihydrofolate synthase [Gemmatimonadales bacterium]